MGVAFWGVPAIFDDHITISKFAVLSYVHAVHAVFAHAQSCQCAPNQVIWRVCSCDSTVGFCKTHSAVRRHIILMEKQQRQFFCLLLLIQSARLEMITPESLFHPDQDSPFPSCVEVLEVWPPPYSVLTPIKQQGSVAHYVMRITFSRPVGIETLDTTGGYQSEIAGNSWRVHPHHTVSYVGWIAPVFLSPSPTHFTRYYSHRLRKWHGSDRTFMVSFTLSGETEMAAYVHYNVCLL